MNENDKDHLVQHILGATVVHQSPFSTIEVPNVKELLLQEECNKWVIPFYLNLVHFQVGDNAFSQSLMGIYKKVSPSIVEKLLTDFNWRPRITGAFFAALKRYKPFEDHVGKLLLRSDLCFAGKIYCVALAEFNTMNGLDYLKRYLEYYLTRPDLYFDQGDAVGAIAYLDATNKTKHFEMFKPLWDAYVEKRSSSQDLQKIIAQFEDEMKALHECQARMESII